MGWSSVAWGVCICPDPPCPCANDPLGIPCGCPGCNCSGDGNAEPGGGTNPTGDQSPAVGRADGQDPVSLFTGEYLLEVTDLKIPGRGLDFEFTRHYSSNYDYNGVMGRNWNWGYHEYLVTNEGNSNVTHIRSDLRQDTYTWNGTKYVSPSGYFNKLVKNGDSTFTLKERSGITKHFRTDGFMDAIKDAGLFPVEDHCKTL